MSQPKRYMNGRWGLDPHESGEWVKWEDYAALAAEKQDTLMVMAKLHMEFRRLQAENERLRSASFVTAVPSEEYEKLKAENERLRKAGDELALSFAAFHLIHRGSIDTTSQPDIVAWNAAKEGGAK